MRRTDPFRFAHEQVVRATSQERILAIDEGPGFATLSSPNAMVRWRVVGSETDLGEPRFFDTGPASFAAIQVGRRGTKAEIFEVLDVLDTTFEVRPATGELVGAAPDPDRPLARGRFWPSNVWRYEYGDELRYYPQIPPVCCPQTITIYRTVPGTFTDRIGFAPGLSTVAHVRSTRPLRATLNRDDPGKVPVVLFTASVASDAFSIEVGALSWLGLINPGGVAADVQITWAPPSVRQV